MDLTDIYRTFHSRIHILLKWTEDILQDKSHVRAENSLNKFKRLKSYQAYLPTTCMQLGIKDKKKTQTWRQNNMLLNNQWVNEEIKEDIKKIA